MKFSAQWSPNSSVCHIQMEVTREDWVNIGGLPRIVNDLARLSKLHTQDTAEAVSDPEPFDLERLCRQALRRLKGQNFFRALEASRAISSDFDTTRHYMNLRHYDAFAGKPPLVGDKVLVTVREDEFGRLNTTDIRYV